MPRSNGYMSTPETPAVPAATPEGSAPEFAGEFDADKATALVTNLRAEVSSLKASLTASKAETATFKEAAEKTGEERDTALAAAITRAEDAERKVALAKHNLPEDVLAEFADYLTGTPEEVDGKAAKLAARLKPAEESSTPPETPAPDPAAPALPERPKPALTPGHGTETPEVFDPVAVAKSIRS